jgi:hypothetical protein
MRRASLTRFQWRTNGAGRGALLLLVRLVKNQWRIGLRRLAFSNGAPMAHGAPAAWQGRKTEAPQSINGTTAHALQHGVKNQTRGGEHDDTRTVPRDQHDHGIPRL